MAIRLLCWQLKKIIEILPITLWGLEQEQEELEDGFIDISLFGVIDRC